MMRKPLAILALVLLGACGQRGALTPPPGQSQPPAPYGREAPLPADRLLAPPAQAVPERSVELRRRSEERADDPFDLPPPEDERDVPSAPDAATGVADQPPL